MTQRFAKILFITQISLLRPIQTLLMNHCSLIAHDEFQKLELTTLPKETTQQIKPSIRRRKRPFIITRSASTGCQRIISQTWSGDNYTSWHSLKWNCPLGLGMSLCGFPGYGHDIGGFYGPIPTPDLFLRWLVHGSFQTRFCIHSFKPMAENNSFVTEPWMFGDETTDKVRKIIRWRYRMIPYFYSLLWKYWKTGEAVNVPLFYWFENDSNVFEEGENFMCGRNILVAPIVEEGKTGKRVYLPKYGREGNGEWWNDKTKEWQKGGQEVKVKSVAMEEKIMFVRQNGVIVMKREGGEELEDRGWQSGLEIYLYPGREEAIEDEKQEDEEFCIVEDDGETEDGERNEINIKVKGMKAQIEVRLTVTKRGFAEGIVDGRRGVCDGVNFTRERGKKHSSSWRRGDTERGEELRRNQKNKDKDLKSNSEFNP